MPQREQKVPAYYLERFPRYRGERLEHFLDDLEALAKGEKKTFGRVATTTPWRGYGKTSLDDRDKIFAKIRKQVSRKAEHLRKITRETRRATTFLSTQRGVHITKKRMRRGKIIPAKTYRMAYDEFYYVPEKDGFRASATGRYAKFDSERLEFGEIYRYRMAGSWRSRKTGRIVKAEEVYGRRL